MTTKFLQHIQAICIDNVANKRDINMMDYKDCSKASNQFDICVKHGNLESIQNTP